MIGVYCEIIYQSENQNDNLISVRNQVRELSMAFNDQLLHAIGDWSKDPIEDEWLFEKFRERFVNSMSTAEAFEAIGETVDVLLHQYDESNAIEVVQTLIALARQSDTTEIPARLLAQKMAISNQFQKFGVYAKNKLQELFDYYRI